MYIWNYTIIFMIMQLYVAFFVLASSSTSLVASNILIKDQQLRDGQTLISAEQNFVLGFFSPPKSTNRYVGIWYYKVSLQTLVWVANRERPLSDSTGTLTINNEGNLVILDWRGGLNIVAYGSLNSNTTAELLENGNLVLREASVDNSGRILWQSFDYPTDSFLPGMKQGRNLLTKQNYLVTSWRSAEDPAPGVYTYGADPNGTTQLFIWRRGTVYWTSGVFNGVSFSLVPATGTRHLFNYSYVSNDEEQYFTYSMYNKSIISRLVLQLSGQIQQLRWSEEFQKWNILWTFPRDRCDVYAPCGAYGTCSTNNTSSLCTCLQGFAPVSPRDWESNNWSDGCRRQTETKCGDGEAFLQFRTREFPDHMQVVEGIGQQSALCESMCLTNCSCTAYASANRTGCRFWSGNLMGLRENFNTTGQVDGDHNIFIRVAASDLDAGNATLFHQEKRKRTWVIAVATVIPVSLILGFFIYYVWRITCKWEGNAKRRRELFALEFGTNISTANRFNILNNYDRDEKGSDLRLYSFATLVTATDNFSSTNKLGEGGFGPVYKGKLPEEQEIAVKRLSRSSGQGLEEFKNEIKLIAKLQHMNLVRLLGCCIQLEEKMLIYEYMPNRSLDSFIFDLDKRKKLDWGSRVHIIEGIAQGLLYLHNYSRLKVIHRDLKASNILLDGEMNPKISDFGMARIFGLNESEASTKRIVGTYGYMAPEYAMRGKFSVKSDVFSFGVLLLEIISGKKNTSYDHLECSLNFLGYAWELWKDNKTLGLMDPVLGDSPPTHKLMRYVNIALLCVQERASDRPTMQEVIIMLGNESTPLPIPKQAAFHFQQNIVDGDSLEGGRGVYSGNGLTETVVEAR